MYDVSRSTDMLSHIWILQINCLILYNACEFLQKVTYNRKFNLDSLKSFRNFKSLSDFNSHTIYTWTSNKPIFLIKTDQNLSTKFEKKLSKYALLRTSILLCNLKGKVPIFSFFELENSKIRTKRQKILQKTTKYLSANRYTNV